MSNNIRLIATDLDRTLLRTDKSISDYTVYVLEQCRARGIKIVFATARPKNRVDILPFLHLADAVIINNGSAVFVENERLFRFPIPADIAKLTMTQLLATLPDVPLSIEYGDEVYTSVDLTGLWELPWHRGFDALPEVDADKIVIHAGTEVLAWAEALLPDDLYAQNCENWLILIMHRSATPPCRLPRKVS